MSGLASLFPPPPRYYKNFTEDAWQRVQQLERDGQVPAGADAELFPPAPPDAAVRPMYRNFGSLWAVENALPSLQESGITQLYPDGTERDARQLAAELQKLLQSVLVQFLGLVQTLHSDATQFPARVEDLRTTLVNMHHLINTYRPLQNKESLAQAMEAQTAALRENAARARETNARAAALLARVEGMLEHAAVEPEAQDSAKVWQAFDLNINLS